VPLTKTKANDAKNNHYEQDLWQVNILVYHNML